MPMTIWVDADAVPTDVKEIVQRAARRREISTILVANKPVGIDDSPFISFVHVEAGADVADTYIVENGAPGDLCITADIPLAARLVDRGLTVIDPRGDEYSADSVGARLATRDFLASLRNTGIDLGGPPPFDRRARQRFAAAFDRLVTRALRASESI